MISYVSGDCTEPTAARPGYRFIVHIVNDEGKWGRGFVLSVGKRWPHVEDDYLRWAKNDPLPQASPFPPFRLGNVRIIHTDGNVFVFNMIAQHGRYAKDDGTPPIRYGALEECLKQVGDLARKHFASVHMPRIGCGLAGGEWSEVERIVARTLHDVEVFVYDYDTGDKATVPWKK